MTIKFIFAWYDIWIGFFWDRSKNWLYVFPIPMLGFILKFNKYIYITIMEDVYDIGDILTTGNARVQVVKKMPAKYTFKYKTKILWH